jgi:hypothetical protein
MAKIEKPLARRLPISSIVSLRKKSAGEDIQDGDLGAQGTTAKTRKFAKSSETCGELTLLRA